MSLIRKTLLAHAERLEMSLAARRLVIGVLVLLATVCIATMGYVWAGWEWVDAIYMVTITIFGVGYGEVRPLNDPGLKLFTIAVIIAGCSSGIYVIGGILQMVTEGEVKRVMGMHSRSKDICSLRDHAIICGFGRVGGMLAEQLRASGQELVVVDCNPERIEQASQEGFLAMVGDATVDSTMIQAGIYHARSLATVLPNDAMNVFITLTARDLCEKIQIIARAESPSTERKLLRSGASQVVMPAAIGAIRIAQLVTEDHAEENWLRDSSADQKLERELSKLTAMRADLFGQSPDDSSLVDPSLVDPSLVEGSV